MHWEGPQRAPVGSYKVHLMALLVKRSDFQSVVLKPAVSVARRNLAEIQTLIPLPPP